MKDNSYLIQVKMIFNDIFHLDIRFDFEFDTNKNNHYDLVVIKEDSFAIFENFITQILTNERVFSCFSSI